MKYLNKCMAVFLSLLIAFSCLGCERLDKSKNMETTENAVDVNEEESMVTSDSNKLYIKVVNQRENAKCVQPLSLYIESIDSYVMVNETNVDMTGELTAFGSMGDDWLEARVVCFPVYSDMMTYDITKMHSTFPANDESAEDGILIDEVDFSKYSLVKLNKGYLLSLIQEWVEYYEAGIEHLPKSFGGVSPEEDAKVNRTVARYEARVEALNNLVDSVDTCSTDENLVGTYRLICRANVKFPE